MKLYTATILYIVLAIAGPSAAVVHGIQSLSGGRFESSNNDNRNGYRYNGPAHKYLPAASDPATEAVTTTGHWLPNPQPQHYPYLYPIQQLPYEHSYSSTPTTPDRPLQQQQQEESTNQYNGPYNMQYYENEHQLAPSSSSRQHSYNSNSNVNTFQFATNHWGSGESPTGAEFVQTYGLSASTQHDRYMKPTQRAPSLIGQALPERYQRQPFVNEQQLGDSASNFVQMQSHSYELPPSYSMERGEWPQHLSAPAAQQERVQAYQYPAQGQAYGHAHLTAPTASPFTSYLTQPSREFQAPYY